MFRLGNWITALDYFKKCNTLKNEDKVLSIYLKRCRDFIKSPPKSWNGAVILDFK